MTQGVDVGAEMTAQNSSVSVSVYPQGVGQLQIRAQEATTLPLKLEPDDRCFVNSLPPEVIAHIFHLLQVRRSVHWLVVTHICRLWRQVAIECPSLWTSIRLSAARPQEASTFIQRAKSLPLTVVTSMTSSSTELVSITEFMLEHLSRIREVGLLISLPPPLTGELAPDVDLQPIFSRPAPLLETLIIRRPSDLWFVNPEPICLGRNLPMLRSIVVEIQPLEWSSVSLRGLRELQLDKIWSGDQPTLSSLMAILEVCPALELLSLFRAGPTIDSLPTHCVNLPHLRKLNLHSDVRQVAALVSRITTPGTLCWTLNCCNPRKFVDFTLPFSISIRCVSLKICFPNVRGGGPTFKPTLRSVGSEQLPIRNRLSFDASSSRARLPTEFWLKIYAWVSQNTGWNSTTELTLELGGQLDDRCI
ncbi:hypothetical protein BD410DRAFT_839686 [Rickenella mellea]|uniref:F-box domain-containing protein n=1 Tax=Rickenella mellea TaxID=50990 RepID=A0A4Y7Q649_9AGAM|nr:hypothetical protein BD410DRAFT_839686 [Rickenella mellea]